MRATRIVNKKATLHFFIEDTLEAGVALFGFEVKSLREGRGRLDGAHVIVRGGEAFLVGADIPAHQPKNAPASFDPARPRKLLISKKEMAILAHTESQKGYAVIACSIYPKGRRFKVEIGIARGKKQFDKREVLKKKTMKRDIEREVKHRSYW